MPNPMCFPLALALALSCAQPPAVPAPARPTPAAAAPAPANAPTPATHPTIVSLQSQPIETTRHARCRMDCRHIDETEIATVLATGTLDPARTRTDGRCPSHALEGKVADGATLRVVFAECPDATKVVTVIDLDRDWPCACD
jgi:hypothetical protein